MSQEREMTRYQCGLVDTCFEEGQYEPGIALLDQLRSSSFKPRPDHVRQLLYIALFPPPPVTGDQTFQRDRSPPSPAKASPTKQKPSLSKASLFPSQSDSETAQRVLFSFLATNSPGALARALPRYHSADSDLPPGSGNDTHDDDSLVAREALCIKNCRNCWAILKQGFIQRKRLFPRDTGKRRTRNTYNVDDADVDQSPDTPTVIADHAWRILDWLLSLFERDELLNFQSTGENFSHHLLSQIPPPRGGSGPRWEAGAPLDIIFHSIEQDDGHHRGMAARLLTLLINLTLSGSFDGPMFVAALTTRLHTSSPQTIQNLLESLPKTVPVLMFKITVCQKFLSSGPSNTGGSKPRPRPLPKRGPRRELATTSSAMDIDVGRAESSATPSAVLATCSDVFQLLRLPRLPESTPGLPASTVKYVLLVSYAHFQRSLPPGERDGDWRDALSNGGLKHVVNAAFPDGCTYNTALMILTKVWQSSD